MKGIERITDTAGANSAGNWTIREDLVNFDGSNSDIIFGTSSEITSLENCKVGAIDQTDYDDEVISTIFTSSATGSGAIEKQFYGKITLWPSVKISFAPGCSYLGYDVSGQSYENTSNNKVGLAFHEDTSTFTLEPLGEVPDLA